MDFKSVNKKVLASRKGLDFKASRQKILVLNREVIVRLKKGLTV